MRATIARSAIVAATICGFAGCHSPDVHPFWNRFASSKTTPPTPGASSTAPQLPSATATAGAPSSYGPSTTTGSTSGSTTYPGTTSYPGTSYAGTSYPATRPDYSNANAAGAT